MVSKVELRYKLWTRQTHTHANTSTAIIFWYVPPMAEAYRGSSNSKNSFDAKGQDQEKEGIIFETDIQRAMKINHEHHGPGEYW